eukprot:1190604-Alexandrium_andersonii.AAC.1
MGPSLRARAVPKHRSAGAPNSSPPSARGSSSPNPTSSARTPLVRRRWDWAHHQGLGHPRKRTPGP